MKIEKINYQKLYPIGSFLNERIGFEASIDEGEDYQEALAQLKQAADYFYKNSNPDLDFGPTKRDDESIHSSQIENQGEEIGVKPAAILSCSSLKILETYRFIIKGKPDLQEAYDTRKVQLQNQ